MSCQTMAYALYSMSPFILCRSCASSLTKFITCLNTRKISKHYDSKFSSMVTAQGLK